MGKNQRTRQPKKDALEQTAAGGDDVNDNIIFKPGNRTVTLQGVTHSVTGGYWECQKCGTSASNKDAISTLSREGRCYNPDVGKATRTNKTNQKKNMSIEGPHAKAQRETHSRSNRAANLKNYKQRSKGQ